MYASVCATVKTIVWSVNCHGRIIPQVIESYMKDSIQKSWFKRFSMGRDWWTKGGVVPKARKKKNSSFQTTSESTQESIQEAETDTSEAQTEAN